MIKLNNKLKAIYFGDKFVKEMYYGNNCLLKQEAIDPINVDTDCVNKSNVSIQSGFYAFGSGGYIETSIVATSLKIYGASGCCPPSRSNIYDINIYDAATDSLFCRINISTTTNPDGDSDKYIDRNFVISIYNSANSMIASTSYTSYGGNVGTLTFDYDSTNGRYKFTRYSYGFALPKSEQKPLKIEIVNKYGGAHNGWINFTFNGYRNYKL